MGYKTDIEIAQENRMEPVRGIAESLGIDDRYIEEYGKYKAKIELSLLNNEVAFSLLVSQTYYI